MTMKRLPMLGIWLLCMAAAVLSGIRMLGFIMIGSDRAWRMAKAYDRVGNTAIGGTDTETISSHAYRASTEKRRWGCLLCKLLDKVEQDHCKTSAGI